MDFFVPKDIRWINKYGWCGFSEVLPQAVQYFSKMNIEEHIQIESKKSTLKKN